MRLRFVISVLLAIIVVSWWGVPVRAESPALRATLERLAKTEGPFTFGVVSDTRSGDRVFEKNIAGLMAHRPLFVVHSGDFLVHVNYPPHWDLFRELTRPITVPLFLTPGNHDIDDERSLASWKEQVDLPGKEIYYSFTVGKNLFVVLASTQPSEWERITGAQYAWLEKTLDPKRYEHQFVFVHHPLYMWKGATHEGEAQDAHPEDRDRLHRLFVDRRVDIVFSGHEHRYRRLEKDGVNYLIVGGGGSPLYGKKQFNHFAIVRVDGERVETKIIDRDGALRDEFVLKRVSHP